MEEANVPPEEVEVFDEVTKKASSIKVASTLNVHGGTRESWIEPLQKQNIELRDYINELVDKVEEKTNKRISDIDRILKNKGGVGGQERRGSNIGPGRGRGGMNKTNTSETIKEESPSRGKPAGRGRGGRGGMSRSPTIKKDDSTS